MLLVELYDFGSVSASLRMYVGIYSFFQMRIKHCNNLFHSDGVTVNFTEFGEVRRGRHEAKSVNQMLSKKTNIIKNIETFMM